MPTLQIILWVTGACGAVWVASVSSLAAGLQRLRPVAPTAWPSVTILIAARNEETNIANCLTALAAQDYPSEQWEAIVIDDNSSDRTADVARSFADRLPGLKVLPAGTVPADMSPKKWALTVGIWQAAGEVILTTDADCAPPPGWVSGMAGMFEEHTETRFASKPGHPTSKLGHPISKPGHTHQAEHTETRFASKPGHPGVEAVVGYSPLITPPLTPPASGRGVKSLRASCLGHTLDAASGGERMVGQSQPESSDQPETPAYSPPANSRGGKMPGLAIAWSLGHFDSLVNATVSAGCIGLGFPSTAVGRNFAFRRAAWEKVGGYPAGASGDDDLLVQRIAAQGGKVVFASDPATFVPAQAPATFSQWWRMKRRHLSAGKRYQPGFVLLSAVLYLFNVGLVASVIAAILGVTSWLWLATVWGVKVLADGAALGMGAKLLREPARAWLPAWLVGELASPFVFTILVPAAMMGRVRWKGRTLDH